MKAVKYRVIYNYERTAELKKDGTAAVLIRAYLGGKYRYFNSGIYITPKQWHSRNRTIVHHPNQYLLNQKLRDEISEMQKFEYEIQQREGQISLERLGHYKEEETNLTFLEFYETQLKKEQPKLSRGTYTDQRQTLDKLKQFRKEITFRSLSTNLLGSFINSLHAEGLSQNTVHKHFKNVRKYVNLAIRYDYISPQKNPCNKLTVKQKPTDRLFLTEYELGLFESFIIPNEKLHWQAVLDLFLFSCYTGLRFSDMASITEDNIVEGPDGIELFLTAQKTQKPYRQNLRKLFPMPGSVFSKPELIIQRRLKQQLLVDEPIFVYTNRYSYSKQLKAIAQRIKIRARVQKDISSHTGRHTFGTIMAGKVDVHILKELMQHAKVKETMIYVHMSRKAIDQALDNVKW